MLYVLRRYGVSLPAAAVGGAVYGFSPALTHSAIGHYQLQFAVLPPLIVDAVLRLCLRSSGPVRAGIWLGVLVVAQIFIGEEMLFEACLAAILLVAVLAAIAAEGGPGQRRASGRARARHRRRRDAAARGLGAVGAIFRAAHPARHRLLRRLLQERRWPDSSPPTRPSCCTPGRARRRRPGTPGCRPSTSATWACRSSSCCSSWPSRSGGCCRSGPARWRPRCCCCCRSAGTRCSSVSGNPLAQHPARDRAAVGLARAPADRERGPRGPAVDRGRRDRRGPARVRHRLRGARLRRTRTSAGPGPRTLVAAVTASRCCRWCRGRWRPRRPFRYRTAGRRRSARCGCRPARAYSSFRCRPPRWTTRCAGRPTAASGSR